jgi:hypothetical protein
MREVASQQQVHSRDQSKKLPHTLSLLPPHLGSPWANPSRVQRARAVLMWSLCSCLLVKQWPVKVQTIQAWGVAGLLFYAVPLLPDSWWATCLLLCGTSVVNIRSPLLRVLCSMSEQRVQRHPDKEAKIHKSHLWVGSVGPAGSSAGGIVWCPLLCAGLVRKFLTTKGKCFHHHDGRGQFWHFTI